MVEERNVKEISYKIMNIEQGMMNDEVNSR